MRNPHCAEVGEGWLQRREALEDPEGQREGRGGFHRRDEGAGDGGLHRGGPRIQEAEG